MLTYALIYVQNYLASLKREEGQGMAEYGLILALVALVAAVGFGLLGPQIDTLIDSVTTKLGGTPATP
jgi:pilus assembly protein Flp/PilA